VFEAVANWLLFRPTAHRKFWDRPPNARVQDVEWSVPGARVHAWWCPTEGWRPDQGALLYFHGNGGNLSHRGPGISRWQGELGTGVLIVDYPGYGRSTGRPTEAGCYAAADAAYAWLTGPKGIAPENVLLYGGSLGCAVAIDLAFRRPHRAMVLVSPFTSVTAMARHLYPLLPPLLVPNLFDSLAKIPRCPRPHFVAHGTADRLVPFAQGQRLFAAANEPKEFFPLEGYDHHHTPGPAFYARLRDFLARYAPLGGPRN
jgi:fermentation-respiration switch protein FrsA (DUF1100 family)